jgi:hypothetical protein
VPEEERHRDDAQKDTDPVPDKAHGRTADRGWSRGWRVQEVGTGSWRAVYPGLHGHRITSLRNRWFDTASKMQGKVVGKWWDAHWSVQRIRPARLD